MQIDIVDKTKKKVGAMEIPERIFGVKWNADLVHQVVTSLGTNRRAPLAHAKTRGEVSGGGKKPWRQKGTGRARHGSTRSPIWVGGGVAFGPTKEKNFARKVNKKMRQKALYAVLSEKLRDKEIFVMESFGVEKPKTKNIAASLKNIRESGKKIVRTLCITSEGNKNAILSGRNIPKNEMAYSAGMNVEKCLGAKFLIFEKAALEEFIRKNSR